MRAEEIIKLISESKKQTEARAFVTGNLSGIDWKDLRFLGSENFGIVIGDHSSLVKVLEGNRDSISDSEIEVKARNSAIPLADLTKYEARIEPGAVIRDMVKIGKGAVIMMGAVINIGSVIGEGTMIDMNAVLGGRATVGKNCHIGAGSVIAGVIEPPSATPVIIEDEVLVGANCVILEGVRIGRGSVIAAGSVVTKDVEHGSVAAGTPARILKKVDAGTKDKTKILKELRNL